MHPLTIETLENLGLSTEGLWSKTIDDCEQYKPEVVITVCDSAAQEACPLYLGERSRHIGAWLIHHI